MNKICALIIALLAGLASLAQTIPDAMNYQGELVDANGVPLATGNYKLAFSFYQDQQGGVPIWTSGQMDVAVVTGLFNVVLGGQATLLSSVFTAESRYLEIKVGDNPPVAPRQRLLSAPYAFSSLRASSLYNAAGDAIFDNGHLDLKGGSISSGSITFSGEITGDMFRAGSIVSLGDVTGARFIGDGSGLTGVAGIWPSSGENLYRNTGRVGVGTSSPRSSLDVTSSGLWHGLTVGGSGGTDVIVAGNLAGTASIGAHTGTVDAWADLAINPDGGNVGVGIAKPTSKLHVNGAVQATSFAGNGTIPIGGIIMWSGSDVPAGWALCNGENSTPDLRDRFIVGAGNSYGTGATGGSDLKQITVEQLPPHSHSYYDFLTDRDDASLQYWGGGLYGWFPQKAYSVQRETAPTGNGALFDVRPQYYAIAFIMRIQ